MQPAKEKITSDIKQKAENTKHRAEKILGFIKNKKKIQGDLKMNNKRLVPEAKEAMDKFKMEAASERMYPIHIKSNPKYLLNRPDKRNWRTEKTISTPFLSAKVNLYRERFMIYDVYDYNFLRLCGLCRYFPNGILP